MREQTNQTSVDLQRALDGASWWGAEPYRFRGPQGSANADGSLRGSPEQEERLLPTRLLFAVIIIAIKHILHRGVLVSRVQRHQARRRVTEFMDGFYFCDNAMPEGC